MSTLNYIDENGNINKAGIIPKNYPASNIQMANGKSVEDAVSALSGLKIYKLSGTTASTVNTFVYLPLPSGVDADKMFVLGNNVRNSIYGWYYSNSPSVICFADSSNGVRIRVSEEEFTSQPFNVLLGII